MNEASTTWLYAVGAPRISRGPDSGTPGPRAHINGFLGGMKACGVSPDVFLMSEHLAAPTADISESAIRAGIARGYLQDLVRIGMGALGRLIIRRKVSRSVDVVYERFATFHSLGRAYQRRGAKWVIESNGIFYREAAIDRKSLRAVKVAKYQEGRTYRSADLVVAVSSKIRDEIVQQFGVPSSKILVVQNGVDPETFNPDGPTSTEMVGPEKWVVFAGQLIEWQGLDDLLRAIALVGTEWNAAIVGDGPDRERLEAMATELGVSDRIRFTGRLEPGDVASMLRGADVAYSGHRSRDNTVTYHSPLKLYEYLSVGLPVISTRSESLQSVRSTLPTCAHIDEFEPGDCARLAACIATVPAVLPEARYELHSAMVHAHSWAARFEQVRNALTAEDSIARPGSSSTSVPAVPE